MEPGWQQRLQERIDAMCKEAQLRFATKSSVTIITSTLVNSLAHSIWSKSSCQTVTELSVYVKALH